MPEPESSDYGAHEFTLDDRTVRFRTAKITPTKPGQFVTVWKRPPGGGPIAPFDTTDPIDLFVISTRDAHNFGQFVFPTAILAHHGVVSTPDHPGKRAFRVYPPWVTPANRQAEKAQSWQTDYFLPVDATLDLARAQALYAAPPTLAPTRN
ncbi:MepB family protein [Nocardia sp. SYP-A9097]|uniref:MepB family protein n=1 Tax=Nocardia sp. SYP-A9097 TaxID=2663237 RepID=UPI0028169B74|nr:MepB family protein [Nocardia sp. SYP-A9097]